MYPPSKLLEVLPRADWLVLACPLTGETRNLIDANAFRHMRKGVRLINIARGHIVDEAALIEAVRSGHLGGAALDSHWQEPLPAESPLWELPNVIISPNNASATPRIYEYLAEIIVENYRRLHEGLPLAHRIV